MSRTYSHTHRAGTRPGLRRLLAGAAAALALSGPLHGAQADQAPPPDMLLRIHGSNTIGDTLMPALVRAFLQKELHYTSVAAGELREQKKDEDYLVARGAPGGEKWVEIFSHGSKTGFEDLGSGSADIGMSSDQIDEQQAADLKPRLGDLRSPEGEHVIALDGIAIIVNPANRVTRLGASQLAGIFGGRVKDWSAVGGTAGAIHIYARNDNSGTWKYFNSAVLLPSGLRLSPAARRIEDSNDLSREVAGDPRGIGFIGLNYIGGNRTLELRATDDGRSLAPNPCTVKTEEYFLARRLYLYTSTHPSPIVARFIRFVTSPAAWPVVNGVGLVSTDPTPLQDAARQCPDSSPHSPEWNAITAGHRRLLTNFNFVSGKATLDTRGLQDLGYLAGVLSRPEYAGHRVLLIGYADKSGSFVHNLDISVRRASAVSVELGRALGDMASGVTISLVAGLGAQDFLKPNDIETNREKNRRVEVWVN
jgi:phosphate transport system substrate-binding protein